MNTIFKLNNLNLDFRKWNQKTFGYKCLKILGLKIWNKLPYHVKSSENLDTFKNLLKNWDGNLFECIYVKNGIY